MTVRVFRHNVQGAAAVEFAVVAAAFFMLVLGILEYGLILFTKSALEAATNQVARSSSVGNISAGCADRACEVKALIDEKTAGLINPESVFITSTVVSGPTTSTPPVPDICFDPPDNPYPTNAALCNAWDENSGDPNKYDPPAALSASALGVENQLVEIRVTYLWKVLFPLFRSVIGEDGVVTITTSTVIQNQPL